MACRGGRLDFGHADPANLERLFPGEQEGHVLATLIVRRLADEEGVHRPIAAGAASRVRHRRRLRREALDLGVGEGEGEGEDGG